MLNFVTYVVIPKSTPEVQQRLMIIAYANTTPMYSAIEDIACRYLGAAIVGLQFMAKSQMTVEEASNLGVQYTLFKDGEIA